MEPDRRFYQAVETIGSVSANYNLGAIKSAFVFAGAQNVVDTEDQYGGFKGTLGNIPFHVYRPSSTAYNVAYYFGPNDEYKLSYPNYEFFAGIIVIKGSTGVLMVFVRNGRGTDSDLALGLDTHTGRIYTFSTSNSSGTATLYAYDYTDSTLSQESKVISATSASGVPGNQTYNNSQLAILTKIDWFSQQLISAPAVYKASLLTNNPQLGEVVMIDSKYYASMFAWSNFNSSAGQYSANRRGYCSIVMPLDD